MMYMPLNQTGIKRRQRQSPRFPASKAVIGPPFVVCSSGSLVDGLGMDVKGSGDILGRRCLQEGEDMPLTWTANLQQRFVDWKFGVGIAHEASIA